MATYTIHRAHSERRYETWQIDTDTLTAEQLRTLIDLAEDVETSDPEGDAEVESLIPDRAPATVGHGPADDPMFSYRIERTP